jgi:hypothetical protein
VAKTLLKSAVDICNQKEREAVGDGSICIPHELYLFFERSVILKMHFV